MRISERELYQGAALSQILEGTGFKSIEKASNVPGHYEVNGSRRVLIRHSAAGDSPWQFILRAKELGLLRDDRAEGRHVFLCLVCRDELVCILTIDQVGVVIDLDAGVEQFIRLYTRRSSSIEVRGSAGELGRKVPQHAFPGRLFYPGNGTPKRSGHDARR